VSRKQVKLARIHLGRMEKVLRRYSDDHFTSCVTDPPYEIAFMGKSWDDRGTSFRKETWQEVLRVLKPGAFLLAFGGTRTYHRIAVAIEDAGFEIRDCIMWVYGSGFPKSHDISKAIDKAAGSKRKVIGKHPLPNSNLNVIVAHGGGYQDSPDITAPSTENAQTWHGYGTALKPAWEPIIVAMKPIPGTFADNALTHGVAGLNIDGSRVGTEKRHNPPRTMGSTVALGSFAMCDGKGSTVQGRWPANVIHDGSDEVLAGFPDNRPGFNSGGEKKGSEYFTNAVYSGGLYATGENKYFNDSGSAARFFYCAKASKSERGADNKHPTVKPLALMRYLIGLVRYPGSNLILDPFTGSGSTCLACKAPGVPTVGIEQALDAYRTACKRLDIKPKPRVPKGV